MSGVRTGTRLDQLLSLRRQVDLAIEHERRTNPPLPTRKPKRKRKSPAPTAGSVPLAEMGVTAAVVRAWAVDQGLMEPGKRGRLADDLVEAYAAAHHDQEAAS